MSFPSKLQKKSNSYITLENHKGAEYVDSFFSDDKGGRYHFEFYKWCEKIYSLSNKIESIKTTHEDAFLGNLCIANSFDIIEKRSMFFEKINDVSCIHKYIASFVEFTRHHSLKSILISILKKISYCLFLKGFFKR